MQFRSSLSVLAAFGLIACIPTRDNVGDPQSAPMVSFSIADTGPSVSGVCNPNPTVPPAGFPRVSEASRGRCLALDAGGSLDQSGSASGLTYTFTIPGVPTPLESAMPLVLIPDAARVAFPLGTILEFGVVVTDKNRHPGFGSTRLLVHNAAPIAVTEAPRTFPLGGYPWTPGADFLVTLDGSASSDPDGDAIRWCWTVPPASESCGDSPRISVTLPATSRSRVVATLRVLDGPAGAPAGDPRSLYSLPAQEAVGVNEQGNWGSDEDRFGVLRVDPRPPVFAGTGGAVPVALPIADGSGATWIAYLDDPVQNDTSCTLRFASPSTGVNAGSAISIPGDGAAMHQDASGTLWVVTADLTMHTRLDAFDLSAGPLAVPTQQLPQPRSDLFHDYHYQLGGAASDGDGRLWWHVGGPDLYELDHGVFSTVTLTGDTAALERRPGSSEVWMAKTPNFIYGGDAALFRLAGATSALTISLGQVAVTGFAWINSDEIWLAINDDGIRRVDMNLLEIGAGLEASTLLRVPSLPLTFGSTVDASTGANWVGEVDSSIDRVDLDGSVTRISGAAGSVLFVDALGDVWTTRFAGGISSSETPDLAGTVAHRDSFVNPTYGAVAPDPSSNGLWLLRSAPPAFSHLAENGSLDRVLPRPPELTYTSLQYAFSPDATFAWALRSPIFSDPNALLRYDLTGAAAIETVVLGSNQIPSGSNSLKPTGIFLGSAPLPASTPFVWVLKNSISLDSVVQIDGAGTVTPRFSIPSGETRLHGINSSRTNRLCLVTDNGPPSEVATVRWLSPGGGVQTFTAAAPTLNAEVHAIGISPGLTPGTDVCWVMWQDVVPGAGTCTAANAPNDGYNYSLRGFTTSSTPARSIDIATAGHIDSFVPVSADSFWTVTSDYPDFPRCSAPNARNRYDRISGTTWNARSFPTTNPPPFLLDPASAIYSN